MSAVSDPRHDSIDDRTFGYIQQKARLVAARTEANPDDRHDLAQDLVLHALEQAHRFNQSRGTSAAFFGQVIEHKAADLAKARRALRRGRDLQMRSLQETVVTADGQQLTLEENATEDTLRVQLGLRPPLSFEEALFASEVWRVLASLTPAERDLCWRLIHASSIKEVALSIGLSRAAVYKRIVRLRAFFRAAGISLP
ncbi:MAG: RNA polymerase sigma factor [Armatimonadota bacterium]